MRAIRIITIAATVSALLTAVPAVAQTESSAKTGESDSALRAEVEELKKRLQELETLLRAKLGEEAKADEAEEAKTETAAAPAAAAPRAVSPGAPASGTVVVPAETVAVVTDLPAAPTDAEPDEEMPVGVASTGGQALSITGLLDTYYTYNTNNPEDGTNTLYYTNPNSRGFGLNQAKLEIDAHGDGPVGFRSDIWFGSGARLFRDGLEPGPLEDVIYLQQAYGYYQFENGAELDIGLFGTPAGLEVPESHLNWNYTRGILWAWNEPFSHLGAKLSMPLTDTFTGTVMVVNGFDNAFDQNSGKSYGLQGSWAPADRFNTTFTWIHGPENDLTNKGWQRNASWNFYAALHPRFEVMGNFDYISNTDPFKVSQTSWGGGGYARFNATDKFRIAQRFEYLDDLEARATGVEHILKEYTLTFEYAPEPRFITRLEYRRDWSTTPFFSCTGCGPTGITSDQDTITLGFMWVFGPKE
ncbi:MAG: DUF3138 family protein [Acidobacteria bacterium]|nr:DUF3138 family protein [Acidobacteriota bacterium]